MPCRSLGYPLLRIAREAWENKRGKKKTGSCRYFGIYNIWIIIVQPFYPEHRFFNERRVYKLCTYKFGNVTYWACYFSIWDIDLTEIINCIISYVRQRLL